MIIIYKWGIRFVKGKWATNSILGISKTKTLKWGKDFDAVLKHSSEILGE